MTEACGYGTDELEKGYTIVDFGGTGMMEIQRIDEAAMFDSDAEAVEAAAADGIKIIPVEELPESFGRRYFGWIDTPENRQAIASYCEKAITVTYVGEQGNGRTTTWTDLDSLKYDWKNTGYAGPRLETEITLAYVCEEKIEASTFKDVMDYLKENYGFDY